MKALLAILSPILLVYWVSQPAGAQDCSNLYNSLERMECIDRRSALLRCETLQDDALQAKCLRSIAPLRPAPDVCDTKALKKDRVACLERRLQALDRELAQMRHDIPRLVEEGVRAAMRPRVHK